MKRIINKILLLIIALLLFGIAIFLDRGIMYVTDTSPTLGFNIDNIQGILHNKETEIETLLNATVNEITTKPFNEFISNDNDTIYHQSVFSSTLFTNIQQKDFAILIYHKNYLKYWSDNSFQVNNKYSDLYFNQKIVNLSNAYYFVTIKKSGDFTVVGLVLIKHKYPYENKFLMNYFQDDFDLKSSATISLKDSSGVNNIYNKNNGFLFSLTPAYTSYADKPYFYSSIILYIISILMLFIFVNKQLTTIRKRSNYGWLFIGFGLFIVLIRYLMIKYELPPNFSHLDFFRPHLYGGSFWFPSLGDFLLNILFIYIYARNFFIPQGLTKYFIAINKKNKKNISTIIISFLGMSLTFVCFFAIQSLFNNLIVNSSISFEVHKVLDLNIYTFIGFVIIALLFSSFLFVCDVIVKFCTQISNLHRFVTINIILLIPILFLDIFMKFTILDLYSFMFFVSLISIIAYIRFKKLTYKYYTYVFIIFLGSLYSVGFITNTIRSEERDERQFLVQKLEAERDRIAEHLLQDIEIKLSKDTKLEGLIQSPKLDGDQSKKIIDYLQKDYFNKDWERYDLEINICGTSKRFEQNALDNCISYYTSLVQEKGEQLESSNFFFLDNMNGSISYFGYYEYLSEIDSSNITLFLELNSKLANEELGYPELLLDKKISKKTPFAKYSYAKYKNYELVNKSGTFPYNLNSRIFNKKSDTYYFLNFDDHDHLIYNIDNKDCIVISLPELRFIDLLISFSYIFLFFNLLLVPIRSGIIFNKLPDFLFRFHFDFKNKILWSMISILLISFLLVGGVTVYYNINKYESKHKESINEKLQSVKIELEQQFAERTRLTPAWKSKNYEHIDELLTELSVVFFTDINLYGTSGDLLASSRPEVFERELIGRKMNSLVYNQLIALRKAEFIHDERIGDLHFSSAYTPIRNSKNKTLAYLNLPYFTKPNLLEKEISTLVVAIINLYVVLFLATIVVAVFISGKITQPLRMLQSRFKEIELGKTNEPINYESHDEIGSLVTEYNLMVAELARNVELLAKTERESAWREMAKQIAHEIKNPLTPMKLSIQFLQRSWGKSNNRDDDGSFGKRLNGVSKTLIDQIDTLSAIATEFSNFARMPKANNETVNIVEKLKSLVLLFENTENVNVTFEKALVKNKENAQQNIDDIAIYADKEQISRVFINLIKNAIQSIPENIVGEIKVELFTTNKIVRIKIEDNGSGIPKNIREKLFRPRFTTKSSGMGMGLAMVKNIVENANGSIWFETNPGEGTRFFVELPKYSLNS